MRVAQIIFSNVFTYFNLIFFLAACVIAVRSWNNAMFMGVVLVPCRRALRRA